MSPRSAIAVPLALALAAALAACGENAATPEPAAIPTAEGDPVSILRPDVDVAPPSAPVEPLNVTISFADGGSELSEEAIAALQAVASAEQFAQGGAITLRGHSDAGGSDAVNMRASQARAEAVRDWLVDNGAEEERITVIAFGEQNPVEPNALPDGSPNEEGRAANRRVELAIAAPEVEDAGGTQPAAAEEPSA